MRNFERVRLIILKFSQAWASCIICMGGGLSLYHATVAAKTGLVGGVGVLATSFLPGAYRNWKSNLALTFSTTFIGDIIVVPTHYGYFWTEALCTGIVACLFSISIYGIRRFINN